jgi:hypothetical protein
MAQAVRRILPAPPAKTSRIRPASQGTAIDPDEKKRTPVKPGAPADKPGAGRSSKLGRKVESPSSLRTAGPSGQRSRTQDMKKHANK